MTRELLSTLDDVLEQLASYSEWAPDHPRGEVNAVGALAVAFALREVAEQIRGLRGDLAGR